MSSRKTFAPHNIDTQSVDAKSTRASDMGAAVSSKSKTRSKSNRGNGRKRRTPGHDPVKHSGKSRHKYEELRRGQEKLILSISCGVVLGGLLGFSLGGYYPLTVGTGLALGLAFGVLNAS